jgi:hypothetical protein
MKDDGIERSATFPASQGSLIDLGVLTSHACHSASPFRRAYTAPRRLIIGSMRQFLYVSQTTHQTVDPLARFARISW